MNPKPVLRRWINADSFFARVWKTPECWIWTGSVGRLGYGYFAVPREAGRTSVLAHRASYVIAHGNLGATDLCHDRAASAKNAGESCLTRMN